MTERLIVTGLINSTEYLQQVRPVWDDRMLSSKMSQEIAEWCIEFYDKYDKAPERNIEDIYYDKRKSKEIPTDMVEPLQTSLETYAAEYGEPYNVQYALDQTNKYFKKRHLELYQEELRELMRNGDLGEAEELASSYQGISFDLANDLDLGNEDSLHRIESVFQGSYDSLIRYPGRLGEMLNPHMIRGGFVSLMASEKRGKSFWLLDMGVRGTYNRCKVAFFQAGDMTEAQQIKRMASYLNRLPSNTAYAGEMYFPVVDCMYNQLDSCDRAERRCGFGIFQGGQYNEEDIRYSVSKEDLKEAWEDYGDDYRPCTVCKDFQKNKWGTPWLIPRTVSHAVNVDEAKRKVKEFFIDKKRNFRISTHPNNTLSVSNIKGILSRWERIDGFIPDIIIIDYADLLVAQTKEFRHAQNEIWKDLRALSQERDCLVLTATQADAKSYTSNLLKMENYSEDKRKYAHVTAMFGLNQDKRGREKQIGIMRINQMVAREGEFDNTKTVTVLQSLGLGQPFLDSFL
jgi:hypothetical protein